MISAAANSNPSAMPAVRLWIRCAIGERRATPPRLEPDHLSWALPVSGSRNQWEPAGHTVVPGSHAVVRGARDRVRRVGGRDCPAGDELAWPPHDGGDTAAR